MYYSRRFTKGTAFFSAIFLIVYILSTTLVNAKVDVGNKEKNSISIEQPYLIGLKEKADTEKFLDRKLISKKAYKKFRTAKLVAVKLSSDEVQDLVKDGDVSFVEPDATVSIASVGDVSKKHNLIKTMKKDNQTIPWGLQSIGADISLKNNSEGRKIKIAVFDTGVSNHPDLKVKRGVSFVDYTSSYTDDNGHGTHVIGTIAAENNKAGIVGVAPESEIYAVKILDQNGSGSYSQIIDAINWAIDNKIDIINMSFGGTENSQALHNAIIAANNSGILVIAAAGNSGAGEETESFPARYPEVMSIGSVDQSLSRASYSSTGAEIDLVAPGSQILSTTSDDEYGVMSGTSMATPHVSGSAAVLWSNNKKMSNQQVKAKLYETATPLGDRHSYGNGLLNIAYALGLTNGPIISQPIVTPELPEIPETDVSFDIVKKDVLLNEYKNKLVGLFYAANENGNTQLAKSIEDKLNSLIIEDSRLHDLPENLQNINKNLSVSSEVQSLVNQIYAAKASEFNNLENKYKAAIDQFSNQVLEVNTSNSSDREITNTKEQEFQDFAFDDESKVNAKKNNTMQISPSASGRSPKIKLDDAMRDEKLESVTTQSIYSIQTTESVYSIQATSTPVLTITSTSSTSVTFNATFPTSGIWGNVIRIMDFNVAQPPVSSFDVYGGNWYRTNGVYTISGLKPGGLYIVWSSWSTDGQWTGGDNSICRIVQIPYATAETLTRRDGTYVFTNLESNDMNYASATSFNTWINRLDSSYLALKDLVGKVPYNGNKIELKSSRDGFIGSAIDGSSSWYMTWGWSGNPAELWQPFVNSHMMRLSNDDWGDTAIHELSHDFDQSIWEFDSEFFADFKEYYVVESLGAKVYRTDTEKYYTGSSFANFFKTDQLNTAYDKTFPYGTYSSRGLVSVFIRIKNTIGWQPFKDTFRYLNNLSSGQVPTSNIGKFNLFMTKLKDYSGTDIISLLSSNEKNVIQNWMGGTISYVVPITAVSISLNTPDDVSLTAGAYKVYKFTPSATGVYNIFTGPYAGTGTSNDTYLELYSDSGLNNIITSNDDSGGTTFSKISMTLTAGTTYYIKLRHYSSSGALYTRFIINMEIPTINLNSPVDVSLPAGAYNVYKFTPQSTGEYKIFTGPYGGTGSSNDTYLELYSDQTLTNKITYNDDGAGNSFSLITKALTGGTTYYIKLRHYSSSTGVHARLMIVKETDKHGNSFSSAAPINIESNVDAGIDNAGDVDYFSFTAPRTGSYIITTTGTTDTYGYLYASNQSLLTYNDDSGEGNNFQIVYNLTANQTYYIQIKHYNATGTGLYTLRITPPEEVQTVTWYKITVGDKTIYIKDSDASTLLGEARVSDTGSSYAQVYNYDGSNWVALNLTAEIPGSGGVGVASVNTQSVVQDIIIDLEDKATEVRDAILNKMGLYPNYMTTEDWEMVELGIVVGIVECTFPEKSIIFPINNRQNVKALIFLIRNEYEPINNYYYMKAKVSTEYAIWIASTIVEAGSYTAAISLLSTAGVSISGGIMSFAGSGGTLAPVSLVLTVESATALAGSGITAIAGVGAGVVGDKAKKALDSDSPKLAQATSMRKLDELAPNELKELSIDELKKALPDGWTFYAGGPNGTPGTDFVHIKKDGNFRIRIDPPDTKTNYRHMHVYNAQGDSLDISGNIVLDDSVAAHIPYNKGY